MHPALAAVCVLLCLSVGVGAAAAAVHLGLHYADAQPVLLAPPEAARDRVEAMFEAVCAGNYDEASTYLLGRPDLGVTQPESDLAQLLWDSLVDSMEYTLLGECYITDEGLAMDATFTCMDLTAVTADLGPRSRELMEQRVNEAENMSQIYGDGNEYREDFVMDVLCDTAQEALEGENSSITVQLKVNLIYQGDQWWIVADTALLDAISGSILI